MKKLLYLLLFLPLGLFGQTQVVNVGTSPNDGTGDNLRNAFIKQNLNWSAVRDSFGNIYREVQTRTLLNDSLDQLRSDAVPLTTYGWLKTDTAYSHGQIITYDQLQSFAGGGGSLGMYQLRGIVGTTTGFPTDGDSLIINTGFISHPHIEVYRDGSMQWLNSGLTNNTGTLEDVYVFNSTTGSIIVRPVFATGEKVIVHAYDPVIWHELIPEGGAGGGGGSGESTLLTSILGFYELDEISGGTVSDATGNQDGDTYAYLNETGKFGKSEGFYDPEEVINIPFNASQVINGNTASVSVWVKLTTLPSATTHEACLIRATVSTSPWETIILYIGTDNKAHFTVTNTGTTDYTVESAGTLSAGVWYNVVGVCNGANPLKLYLNGADVSASAGTFSGTMYVNDSNWYMGNEYGSGSMGLVGNIDAVGIWSKALSGAEVTELQTATYPFN